MKRVEVTAAPTYDRRASSRLALLPEQQAAVEAREPVVALSAGAGSGKTTVLVERFLDLVVRDGVSPLGILAITYTDKAAAEMKERIVRRFEERGDDTNRRRAESAYISTIHGFCARLLRENPLAAGVDPAFGVMDEIRLGMFLDEELERLYEDVWFLSVMGSIPKRWNATRPRLFELIVECVFASREFGKGIPEEEALDVDGHVAAAMRRIDEHCASEWERARSALLEAEELIRGVTVSGPKRGADHAQLCALLTRLAGAECMDLAIATEYCGLTSFTAGIKDREAAEAVKEVTGPARETLRTLSSLDRDAEERIERELIAPLKAGIYERARELRARYERLKAAESLLDFEDLQRRALALLDRAEVRAEYSERFAHILLDEAQDTNDIQLAVVRRLIGGEQSLFAVGDVKQSIYGFRGADVSLFQELHRAAGSGKLSLVDNHRSREAILDFVNAVGEDLWEDGALDFEELVPRFPYDPRARGAAPHVEALFVERPKLLADDGGKPKLEDAEVVREREALAIAGRIRRMVEGGAGVEPTVVWDRHEKRYRGARWGDIAVLAARRRHFPAYERALAELGVPAISDGGGGFWTGREVQDVLSALRVVANPLDDPALLAALRSPLFGWSDADLVRLRRAAGKHALWTAMETEFVPRDAGSEASAFAILSTVRRLAVSMPPAALIAALCEMTAYHACLLRTPRGRSAVANLGKLADYARAGAETDGPSLRAFIRRAELAEAHLSREQDAPIAGEGDDVVVLSTIHGAKGLEWPIVFIPSLDGDFARPHSGSLYAAADGVLLVEPLNEEEKKVTPKSHLPVRARQRARDEAEAKRLFYVALTRAREYLVLSGAMEFPDKWKEQATLHAPIDWLAERLAVVQPWNGSVDITLGDAEVCATCVTEASVAGWRAESVAAKDEPLRKARELVAAGRTVSWNGISPEQAKRIGALVDTVIERPALPLPAASPIAMTTVTQLVYFHRCPMVYYFDLVLQIEEHPARRRRGDGVSSGTSERRLSALELGTQVHELLERADFGAPAKTEAARLAASTELGSGERARVEKLLGTVLADPIIDRARAATRLEREYPFYMDVGGTVVQGVIDLVFEDASGKGVVVDYKSNDLAAPDRVNVLTRYYTPQIEMYALAAGRAGLVQPAEATLYFLNKGEARTIPVDASRLEVVEGETAEALARISRGDWSTEPGEKCRRCGYRKRGFCEVGRRFVE